MEFEIAYVIDNLQIQTQVRIGDLEFRTADDTWLQSWNTDNDHPIPTGIKGKTIALITVSASSEGHAFEVGLPSCYVALDSLRIAGFAGTSMPLLDELFLFEVNGDYLAKNVRTGSVVWGFHRPFRPVVTEMAAAAEKGLQQYPFLHELTNNTDTLPESIQTRLRLALHWIGRSFVRNDWDEKIVDLCTALEVMLLPGYRGGRKGEMIAIRYWLLTVSSGMNPQGIVGLYNLRSEITHGSTKGIVWAEAWWNLRLECLRILELLTQIAASSGFSSLEELLDVQASEDNLNHLIDLIQKGLIVRNTRVRQQLLHQIHQHYKV